MNYVEVDAERGVVTILEKARDVNSTNDVHHPAHRRHK